MYMFFPKEEQYFFGKPYFFKIVGWTHVKIEKAPTRRDPGRGFVFAVKVRVYSDSRRGVLPKPRHPN